MSAIDERPAAPADRSALERFFTAWPPLTLAALAWIALMVVVAFGADFLAPYSFTALDLRARLAPPVFMGGVWAHPLGSDELGRDVLSRLIMSIRLSMLIAFFGTMIAATLGTTLGFVAAHFRRQVEAVVLMLIDFRPACPFSSSRWRAGLFATVGAVRGLIGLNSERYARIAHGLTISPTSRAMPAVRQLAPSLRVYGLHVLPNIASTLIVSMTITFPETICWKAACRSLGWECSRPSARSATW